MQILFAAESKATYQEEFIDFFEFIKILGSEGLKKSQYGAACKKFKTFMPQDLSIHGNS